MAFPVLRRSKPSACRNLGAVCFGMFDCGHHRPFPGDECRINVTAPILALAGADYVALRRNEYDVPAFFGHAAATEAVRAP